MEHSVSPKSRFVRLVSIHSGVCASCLEGPEIYDINQILSDATVGSDTPHKLEPRSPSPSESPRESCIPRPPCLSTHVFQSPLHILPTHVEFSPNQIKNNPLATRGIVIFFPMTLSAIACPGFRQIFLVLISTSFTLGESDRVQ